jgi:Flp pilus assembly CpaF family ATPase
MDSLVIFDHADGSQRTVPVAKDRMTMGRSPASDIVLPSSFISKDQAVLEREGGRCYLRNVGLNPVRVGEREVTGGRVELKPGLEVRIGTFGVSLEGAAPGVPAAAAAPAQALIALERDLHDALLRRLDLRSLGGGGAEPERAAAVDAALQSLLAERLPALPRHVKEHALAEGIRLAAADALLGGARAASRPPAPATGQTMHWTAVEQTQEDVVGDLLREVKAERQPETRRADLRRLDEGFAAAFARVRSRIPAGLVDTLVARHVQRDLKNLVFGFGPLQDLVDNPSVSEIMVVGRDQIFAEKDGVIELTGRSFLSDEMALAVIERIVAPLGRRVDRSSPIVDARLPDGSRVHAVIPPVALKGPTLTIRKFARTPFTVDDLVANGALTEASAGFLRQAVVGRRSLLLSGGTSSGKTTLLNVLSGFIPPGERIVTIEDAAELQLAQEHLVALETRPPSLEGRGEITMRDLVRTALRMRPDRIIVGECRGAEAFDMLQAMNTGHAGSMTTAHANSASDALLRLEMMVLMAADLPVRAIRQQIAAAVQLVVQLERSREGARRVVSIAAVRPLGPSTDALEVRELFGLRDGRLEAAPEAGAYFGR